MPPRRNSRRPAAPKRARNAKRARRPERQPRASATGKKSARVAAAESDHLEHVSEKRRAAGAIALDSAAVDKRIAEIKKLRSVEQPWDIAERCEEFKLPLVLRQKADRALAFSTAIAELAVAAEFEGRQAEQTNDLSLLLAATFGRNILDQFHTKSRNRKERVWSILLKQAYRPFERDRIIGLVYPWYNYSLYADLLRITCEQNLNMALHQSIAGRYRYFRFFPKPGDEFVLMDGFFDIEIDRSHNMICFGQTSMNHRRDGYEHRGFVFPGPDKMDFLTFRGGAMRLGTIWGHLEARSDAILLTSAKGNKRPFAARVLIVKKGQDLFDLDIPPDTTKKERTFLEASPEYQRVLEEFTKISDGTVFEHSGFMWGNKLKPIT